MQVKIQPLIVALEEPYPRTLRNIDLSLVPLDKRYYFKFISMLKGLALLNSTGHSVYFPDI